MKLTHIILIAFAIFIWYLQSITVIDVRGPGVDFYACYGPQAKGVWHGEIPMDDFRGPLYQTTVGILSWPTKDPYRTAQWLQLALALGTAFFMLKIGTLLKLSEYAKTISLLCLLVAPAFIDMSSGVGTDMMITFLITAGMYAILSGKDVWTGILVACAVLTKQTGFALIIPALYLKKKKWLVIVASAVVLWAVITKVETGSFVRNNNVVNAGRIMMENTPIGHDAYYDGGEGVPVGWVDILTNPKFVSAYAKNIQDEFFGIFSTLLFFPLSIFAAYGIFRIEQKDKLAIILSFVIFYAALVSLSYVDVRFYVPILPFLAIGLGVLCDTCPSFSFSSLSQFLPIKSKR